MSLNSFLEISLHEKAQQCQYCQHEEEIEYHNPVIDAIGHDLGIEHLTLPLQGISAALIILRVPDPVIKGLAGVVNQERRGLVEVDHHRIYSDLFRLALHSGPFAILGPRI